VYEIEGKVMELQGDLNQKTEEVQKLTMQRDSLRSQVLQANSEAQASKAQMEGLVQGQAGLLKKATESTTTMYHADLAAFTRVLELKAGNCIGLAPWSRDVQADYTELCVALAPLLPYPVPARPPAERKVVEAHVKMQARVVRTIRSLVSGGAGGLGLGADVLKTLDAYEALQIKLGLSGDVEELAELIFKSRKHENDLEEQTSQLEAKVQDLEADLARARRKLKRGTTPREDTAVQ